MIPKTIHYCWFGNGPIPEKDQRCIESWRKQCPDYQIIKWCEDNYDISKSSYMLEAYEHKKWGFVSDYARLDIVYEHGGIYLDTDVELIRPLDDLLENEGFMSFEEGIHVSSGLCLAAEDHNETVKALLDLYSDLHFVNPDGNLNITPCPVMQTNKLLEMGLVQDDSMQIVGGIKIFPHEYFCPLNYNTGILNVTKNTYGIHWFHESWRSPLDKRIKSVERFFNRRGPRFAKLSKIATFPLRACRKIRTIFARKAIVFSNRKSRSVNKINGDK